MAELSSQERELLALVGRAAFANPFSGERQDLDTRIASAKVRRAEKPIVGAIHELRRQYELMDQQKRAHRNAYSLAKDKKLFENFALFLVFHEHIEDLDQLIKRQMAQPDRPHTVGFAARMLDRLKSLGFNPDESARFLGVFYQLRRAYFFINHALVGASKCMIALRCQLWNSVFTHDMDLYNTWFWNKMEDFSTLIVGETGTGKGTAAAAIGRSAFIPYDASIDRFKESFASAFTAVNLTQYPESLLEAELFGYRKGAFTGAVESHTGLLARCSAYGAVLLDEIGDVSRDVQVKLLKVLEERSFTPVGSHEIQQFRGRIIAATHQDLQQLRAEGRFREDFYYRLSSDVIQIPPLRQRISEDKNELELLLSHIVTRLAGEPSPHLVDLCMSTLKRDVGMTYEWPGNVREVAQAVRRIVLTCEYMPSRVHPESPSVVPDMNATAVLGSYAAALYERYGSYQKVAHVMELDRRTVKRYIDIYKKK
ncbi:MAG: sigma-54-dependent Fis family transcriptional regulator [Acidobacteria bacterium]|nr:sigma-54-dependent Fis family transcriptional regulator [Acidobacteriota bacterium]